MLTFHPDKFGYYQVDNLKTYSKFEAIELSQKLNKQIKWNFNDEVFSSIDWKKEPDMSLWEMYKERARQIRSAYDYVVLWYSGGSDSHNMLCAWIDAGCKIDEIATTVNYDATGDKNNYMNTEIYNVVVPHVEQLQQKFDFKFRIVDISEITLDLFKKWDTNFEYNVNFHFSPNYPARSLLRERVNDYKNIIDSGKKMCFVWGKEKPILQYENKQHFLFVDSIDNTVSPYIQRKYFEGWYDELFYWTPDYPLLPVKMAHTLKNYIDFTEDDEHFADDPYRKNFFSPKLNKYLNHNFIKLLLYPKWSSIIHDAGKPLSLTYSQRDFWFLSGTSDERNKFIDITNNYFDKFQSRKESRRCVMPIYSDKYYLE
jgi:hypothetical protein